MLRRRVILGGLIAGAFLLPAVAGAGVVTGVCSNCHTMHNSQNGTTPVGGSATPQNTLLLGSGCVGCHAIPGAGVGSTNDVTTGKPLDGTMAPQVDNVATAPTGAVLNGGYFDFTASTDAHQHNILGITTTNDIALTAGGNVSPGGAFVVNNAGKPVLTCNSCHGAGGLHHGTTGTSYRGLTPTTTSTANAIYGAKAVGSGFPGTRSGVAYNATSQNLFCASCHGSFHGTVNQDGNSLSQPTGDGIWIRHPTDIRVVTNANQPSITPINATTDIDQVVVGTDGTNNDMVMCLSCHVPHGGPYNDLLSFAYDASNNVASLGTTGTASVGCETCHSYSGHGM
ncbi:MAG: hypothetical protein HGA96_03835 [Desulfobulbaceae bacterium]|nr:hypothetical protein [Desulfobulbaceae bacterium]